MSRTRTRAIVAAVALVCVIATTALLRKPAAMTLVVDRYLTNVYGPDTLIALVALSNAAPRGVFVARLGLPVRDVVTVCGMRLEHPALPQSNYLGPRKQGDFFEVRVPGRVSVKCLAFDLDHIEPTVVQRFQFWMDRHLLRCDRRTNVYTLHFDVPS
jgi:hypothetical protein